MNPDEPPQTSPELSCFFPAFNEADNIAEAVREAIQTLPKFASRFEVIVVDDGSRDGTADVVRRLAAEDGRVRLVQHPSNLGYGRALRTGLAESAGDVVFFTDGDRQFRLSDLDRLFERLEGAEIVVGYRLKRNDPWHRLVVAFVYHHVLQFLFGIGVRDVDCAFKLFRRPVLDAVLPELTSTSAFISPELLIRAKRRGFRVAEVGVKHYPRVAGRPKGATPKVIWRTITEIAAMRRAGQISSR